VKLPAFDLLCGARLRRRIRLAHEGELLGDRPVGFLRIGVAVYTLTPWLEAAERDLGAALEGIRVGIVKRGRKVNP
jgi:hypothetical protein